ncbi:DoxX family protein [Amorphus sp. 3PC139-8]|uniref:DoxX family protein n=1 Tax=Amorphus sp. 3PC139-8 TaxID=2735676 RepID=UPI00345DACBB
MKFMQRWTPELLSLLRIISAASFFTHGAMKLFAWPAPFEFHMNSILYLAGVLEVCGGFLLVLGLFSRPVAFVLSGSMAVAYFMVHASGGFFPVLNHGEAAMLYCFVFLYIAAAGPGPLSVDALVGRSKQRQPAEAV